MSDRLLRFAIVLQTPKDQQSAVYIGYQSLAQGLEHLNHSVTIVAPSDFPRVARLSGRWTPLVYPLALASWLGDRRDKFDLVMFHSYSGWVAQSGWPWQAACAGDVSWRRAALSPSAAGGGAEEWPSSVVAVPVTPGSIHAVRPRNRMPARIRRRLSQPRRGGLPRAAWVGFRFEPACACAWRSAGIFRVVAPAPSASDAALCRTVAADERHSVPADAAAATFSDGYADMRLVCAGTLAAEDQVIAHFPEALRDRVTVLPRVDQTALAQLYRDADVFVFPSLYEGFSRAIVEAMASRLPIVCTSRRCCGRCASTRGQCAHRSEA